MDNVLQNSFQCKIRALKLKLHKWESGKMARELTSRINVLTNENNRLKNKVISLEDKVSNLITLSKKRKEQKDELDEISDLIDKIIEENQRLRIKNERLKKEKEESDKQKKESGKLVSSLRNQLNKSSLNSSIPSSLDRINHKKKANEYNSRTKSLNHVGGQIGHVHHSRKDLSPTVFIDITITDEMRFIYLI